MEDFNVLYQIIVIILLCMVCFILWFWLSEHNQLMGIINHHIVEIKKKIQQDYTQDK